MSTLENLERARFALTNKNGSYVVTRPSWRFPFIGSPGDKEPREPKQGGDGIGGWLLAIAALLLTAEAIAMGIVSWHAQYSYVYSIKHAHLASALEALGLDSGAVIFSILGVALARLGRRAVIERALVVVCALGSAGMNLAGANLGSPRSVAVFCMPPILFAITSDRLVSVIRRQALGPRDDDDAQRSAWRLGGIAALYLLRFVLAPLSTATGARRAVLNATPLPAQIVTEPETVHEVTSKPRPAVKARPARPAITDGRSYGGQPTKTSRFLAEVVRQHGPIGSIALDDTARIAGEVCADTADAIGMDPGNGRTVLRKAVLAASNGHGTDEETTE